MSAMADLQPRGPTRARVSSPTLIGRDREVAVLREAMVNPPALILIEGEAGIGKSRLVREAVGLGTAEQGRVLLGHCHRLSEPFLLGPIVEALRGLSDEPLSRSVSPVVGALRPLLPELAGVLPAQPVPAGDPRADRHRVFRALRELLRALGPAVCVLEDLHWADEGTFEFISFLLSEPPGELVLILTYRDEDIPPLSSLRGLASRLREETLLTTIELSALTAKDLRRMVGAIVETEVSEEFASDLHQRTAGIPFLVEEVIRLLRDQDKLGVDQGGATRAPQRLGVPAAIRQSIRERMEPLGRDARLITCSAAVLAIPVDEYVLAKVADLPRQRASRGLTEALGLGLLEEAGDGKFGFRHALAAEAAHAEIPAPERRRLHLRAGRALETGPEPRPFAQLVYHFKAANLPRRWTRYAQAAAEAANSIGNAREAAQQLEQALSAPGVSHAARIRMAVKLGSAALSSVSPSGAIAILQRTLDEESMPVGVRGELRLSLSRLRSYVGDGSWREEMIQAVGELQGRPELAAPAMANLAWPTTGGGTLEDHLSWLGRSVHAAARTHDPVVTSIVRSQRAAILLCVGDPEGWSQVREMHERSSSIDEKLLLLQRSLNLSLATLGLGHCQSAESFLTTAVRIHDELEHVRLDVWIDSAKIGFDWRVGRWQGLEARARALMQSTQGRPALSLGNELVLGSLLLGRGRVKEAEKSFAAALELTRQRGWMTAQVTASARLGRIRLARGDAAGACRICALGLDVLRGKGIWVWASELAPVAVRALLDAGQRPQARDLGAEFAAGLQGRDAPAARAASACCQGVIARAERRYDAAARLLGTAERRWRELPYPYEAAQAREERAHCLLAQEDTRGGDLLLGALETFHSLGASWDVGRVRAQLRAEGLSWQPPSRGGRGAYGDGLSRREAQVAQLAAIGRKNREIAEELCLSTRTVEVHVASALRKLGVDSRKALVSREEESRATT